MRASRLTGPNIRRRLGAAIVCLFLMATAGIWEGRRLLNDPDVILLIPHDGAQWIAVPRPTDLFIWMNQPPPSLFRTHFQVPVGFGGAEIEVRALRDVKVYIDRQRVFQSEPGENWKKVHHIEVPVTLAAGRHLLDLVVRDAGGPALVMVYGPKLNLRTDESWKASGDGKKYLQAVLADTPKDPALEYLLGPCSSDLAAMSPLLGVLFATGVGLALFLYETQGGRDWVQWLRWGLLVAWLLLAANNYFKFSLDTGYDVSGHLDYIHFIDQHGRVPLPNDGWELFQSPLFYLISAVFYRLIELAGVTGDAADRMLRIVPILCCVGIVEICYRAGKLLFRERRDLQAVAMVIGGLMPMNIYMAPAVSNEPMAGFLGSLIVLCSFYFLLYPEKIVRLVWQLVYGGLLGAAILTKITAVLWIPPIVFVLVGCFYSQGAGVIRWGRAVMVVVTVSVAICSWYFIRNWIKIGTPFLTGSQLGSVVPVQDPGFRTPHQFLEFGRVFSHPVYSGLNSVWDSLYDTMWADGFMSGIALYRFRPLWNFRLMSCGLWLSVFPMLALLAGAIRCVVLSVRQLLTGDATAQLVIDQFAVLASGGFVGAIALEYLKNPMYSYAKATYMMGLIPCFAILGARGFEMLPDRKMVRAIAAGSLACWGAVALFTYWIV